MKYIAFPAMISCFVLLSCGQNEGGGPKIEAAKPSLPELKATPTNTTTLPVNNASAPASNNAVISTAATAKLNPAHGQPGHRCDVAVGAPLSEGSAPAVKSTAPNNPVISTPVQTITTPVIQPQTNTVSSVTATGLNPAHGQPGHRCDIPVGQPLNSTPKKN